GVTPDQGALEALARRLDARFLRRTVPLSRYTTFRIGGPADLFYTATTRESLVEPVTLAAELGVPCFLLGTGANILVGDRGFRGLVIHNRFDAVEYLDPIRIRAGSGAVLHHDLIHQSVARGLAGLHHYVGIPSSVGGAMWQNLHFLSPPPERERTVFIEEVVEEVELLTPVGGIRVADRTAMCFGYDWS